MSRLTPSPTGVPWSGAKRAPLRYSYYELAHAKGGLLVAMGTGVSDRRGYRRDETGALRCVNKPESRADRRRARALNVQQLAQDAACHARQDLTLEAWLKAEARRRRRFNARPESHPKLRRAMAVEALRELVQRRNPDLVKPD